MRALGPSLSLFDGRAHGNVEAEVIGPQAAILRAFACDAAVQLLADIAAVERGAPLRHMITRGGRAMSVAMTNCGRAGWISDGHGYRYAKVDPLTGREWPPMPPRLRALARDAASAASFEGFEPDACLVNRYSPGTRLSLHEDKDERDYGAPIVSVSLGLPAIFLFGGASRAVRPQRHLLEHGDVVVWGGQSRRYFHGVAPLADGEHPLVGRQRLNLTLRRAL
jgi:alkylated DNA repair protein (DNA oxidative demethylase)